MPEPGEIAGIIGALAALLGSGAWLTQIGLRATNRRKAEAEAAGAEAGVSSTLFAEWQKIVQDIRSDVQRLRTERDELLERLAASEAREEELSVKLRKALRDIEDLERKLTEALADIARLKAELANPRRRKPALP